MKNLCLVIVDLTNETFEKISSLLGEKYRIITKKQLNDGTEYEKIEIILGNPSDELLSKCKNLKWLQLESSGADRYAKILDKSKTVLTNATGAYGHAIAEYLSEHPEIERVRMVCFDDRTAQHYKNALEKLK